MNIALKITSYLSVLLAVFLLYKLVEELLLSEHNYPISDINPVAIVITLFVVLNAVLSVLLLMKRIKSPSQSILIVQIIILSMTSLVLYQAFFNSTISCS